jgi:hypothetical protein
MIKHNHQKGATLYFSIVIMSILLATVFSITSIVLVQIKSMKEAGDSVLAFYAADTGVERALNDLYKMNLPVGGLYNYSLGSADYKYEVSITQPNVVPLPLGAGIIPPSDECSGEYYCIKSIGTYYNVKRAIEAKR